MGPKVGYGYVCLRVHDTCATCVHRKGLPGYGQSHTRAPGNAVEPMNDYKQER